MSRPSSSTTCETFVGLALLTYDDVLKMLTLHIGSVCSEKGAKLAPGPRDRRESAKNKKRKKAELLCWEVNGPASTKGVL